MQYRKTKQRELILDTLKNTKAHPTAEWVYKKVRRKLPNISLGTIYRNLRHLVSVGNVVEFTCQGDPSKFDANTAHHYHITCGICNAMIDVEEEMLSIDDIEYLHGISRNVEDKSGYKVLAHCMRFRGICPTCIQTTEGGD